MTKAAPLIGLALGITSGAAYACVSVSPHANTWSQCAYKVAHSAREQKFIKNYALAIVRKKKLLATATPRWEKLKPRIVKNCGNFANAVSKDEALDAKALEGRFIPENEFSAISNAEDIEKLVKY